MVAQRLAPRIHSRKRRSCHRHANHADHHDHERAEQIDDEGDAERSRPRADLKNLDAFCWTRTKIGNRRARTARAP